MNIDYCVQRFGNTRFDDLGKTQVSNYIIFKKKEKAFLRILQLKHKDFR